MFILDLIFTEFFNMRKLLIISTLFLVVFTSCESATYDEISSKEIITEKVTYNKQVKNIMEAKCTSCHSAVGSASFLPLNTYDQVSKAVDKVLDRIQRPAGDPLRMPQGGTMSQNDINLIKKWKEDGLIQN